MYSGAIKEPGTAEPFISHPQIDITALKGFLLLMSDGLYNAHVAVSNSLHTVNHDIACLVQRYMDRTHVMDGIAQLVIDEISNRFHSMVRQEKRSARLDDITLIIRNLGYPMGSLVVTSTAPPAVQNPFDFTQSQPHPPVGVSGRPHYENSRFLQKQFDTLPSSISHQPYSHTTEMSGGYTPHQPQLYSTHSRPPDTYITNSMYAEPSHGIPHHPHPSGPNVQYSRSGQPSELYPASSATPTHPQGMRTSGSDPRITLPPPVTHHGTICNLVNFHVFTHTCTLYIQSVVCTCTCTYM